MAFAEDLKMLYVGGPVAAADIFLGTKSKLPAEAGPYTTIIETPAFPPEYIHNQSNPGYEYFGAQVMVRSASRIDARDRARRHFDASSVWNRALPSGFYRSIRPTQEPWDFGLDDTGRIVYLFNVQGEKSTDSSTLTSQPWVQNGWMQ